MNYIHFLQSLAYFVNFIIIDAYYEKTFQTNFGFRPFHGLYSENFYSNKIRGRLELLDCDRVVSTCCYMIVVRHHCKKVIHNYNSSLTVETILTFLPYMGTIKLWVQPYIPIITHGGECPVFWGNWQSTIR